jgi:transcriptional regulator with XRE-family HTH domain
MPSTNAQRQHQAQTYGKWLRTALNETGTSIYRLSRKINPLSPESARSNIQRYLAGKVLPGVESRHELATALGRPELKDAPGEEARDPVTTLMEALRAVVREELAEREMVA